MVACAGNSSTGEEEELTDCNPDFCRKRDWSDAVSKNKVDNIGVFPLASMYVQVHVHRLTQVHTSARMPIHVYLLVPKHHTVTENPVLHHLL